MVSAALAWVAAVSLAVPPVAAQTSATKTEKAEKIDPVVVVGCLKEAKPGQWTLAAASDPVPSSAVAPSAKELTALPKGGKNEFQLIGVSIFNLPAHRDHLMAIKGLPVKSASATRLNVTSVTMVAETCR